MTEYKGTFMLDLDGVVYPFTARFYDYCLEKCWITKEQWEMVPDKWSFYEYWGWNSDSFVKALRLFAADGQFNTPDAHHSAISMVDRLMANGWKVIVCTHRPEEAQVDTRAWVSRNFGSLPLYFNRRKSESFTTYPKPWVALEDSPQNIKELMDDGVTVIRMHRSWNMDVDSGYRVRRVQDVVGVAHEIRENWEVAMMGAKTVLGEVRVTDPVTGGQKGTKPERFDLVPVGPLTELARHYGKGAAKYEDRNWEKGYKWSLSYAALQRHLTAWWNGEDKDAEMDGSHLAAVAFHVFALMEFQAKDKGTDDRPR